MWFLFPSWRISVGTTSCWVFTSHLELTHLITFWTIVVLVDMRYNYKGLLVFSRRTCVMALDFKRILRHFCSNSSIIEVSCFLGEWTLRDNAALSINSSSVFKWKILVCKSQNSSLMNVVSRWREDTGGLWEESCLPLSPMSVFFQHLLFCFICSWILISFFFLIIKMVVIFGGDCIFCILLFVSSWLF